MKNRKPFRVKARITRRVDEIVIAMLDRNGDVVEIDDVLEELDYDDVEIVKIQEVRDFF